MGVAMKDDVAARQLLSQGAEARVYVSKHNGKKCIAKVRFEKKYRHPVLEAKLRKRRVIQEAKALRRCKELKVATPEVLYVGKEDGTIVMDFVEGGIMLKDYLHSLRDESDESKLKIEKIAGEVGKYVGLLHKANTVHGDLTTSNMMVVKSASDDTDPRLVMIDFGLSYTTTKREDKAVDLYVLERALLSTHPDLPDMFGTILKGYGPQFPSSGSVVQTYRDVRNRGRKRSMIG